MKSGSSIRPTHLAVKAYYDALTAYAAHGAAHEGATETAFCRLLADTAPSAAGWTLIPKQGLKVGGKTIIPDGTLRDAYNLPRGYWEAKDTNDDLDDEIRKKIEKKYPLTNIIFEDTRCAVLFQNGTEARRFDLTDREQLGELPAAFADAGRQLAELHLNYEALDPYPLQYVETPDVPLSYVVSDKMKLSQDRTSVRVNDTLTLAGVPPEVSNYRLGNRSALEWVIDQYRVSEDARSGIRSDPNRPDNPEYIVRLVGQVIRVSVETVKIVAGLPEAFAT